ncbi:hypothetical protein SLEP1_g33205 [Rubroshorea leprosula]|uniref:Uncharacterized protein n=1 Tax=Rubroshorea leprosula TaxID=152421 RepID=A0AAV5KG29_9ROSI|nr:hypothetical protein SLEP1_g33205 [Rubroshorea leprosula]
MKIASTSVEQVFSLVWGWESQVMIVINKASVLAVFSLEFWIEN